MHPENKKWPLETPPSLNLIFFFFAAENIQQRGRKHHQGEEKAVLSVGGAEI